MVAGDDATVGDELDDDVVPAGDHDLLRAVTVGELGPDRRHLLAGRGDQAGLHRAVQASTNSTEPTVVATSATVAATRVTRKRM